MNGLKRLTYAEEFSLDLSSADILRCEGADVSYGTLRGYAEYAPVVSNTDYLGLVGATEDYVFAHSGRNLRRFDGEKVTSLFSKLPMVQSDTTDARYDIYRGTVYMAFDSDGVIRHNPTLSPATVRWAYNDNALDVAAVNERLAILVNGGRTLRFAPVNSRLYSDSETKETVLSVELPSAVQAIVRCGFNTLYALGNSCYKVEFSSKEEDIRITVLAENIDKVIMHSAVKLGDKIIFASVNGALYSLKNNKITRIFKKSEWIIKQNADTLRAVPWRGKYVLTFAYGVGRSAYVLDVDNEKCCGALYNDIVDVCAYKGADVAVTADGRLVQTVADLYHPVRFLRSGVDFGVGGDKYLRSLTVLSKYDVTVSLTNELNQTRRYLFKGSDKPCSLRICGKGKVFELEIFSQGQTEVSKLEIAAETYKEGYYSS